MSHPAISDATFAESFDNKSALPVWLLVLSATSMLVTLYLVFIWVSTEVTMGIIQRIFYFHVPAATASFLAVFVGGVSSILYLRTKDARYDDLALAANESVVIFQSINIIMGSIWAKRAWGIWWTWDARLTSSLILVLIYFAYLFVRKATPIDQRATVGAVISIFGMIDVPIIYMSNRWFRTQHPSPVIAGGEKSGLDADMMITFLAANVTMLLLWWCVIRVRRRVERLERKLDFLTRLAHEGAARERL